MGTRQNLLDIATDTMGKFLYYDRKECDKFSPDEMSQALKDELVTIDELVDIFRKEMESTIIK